MAQIAELWWLWLTIFGTTSILMGLIVARRWKTFMIEEATPLTSMGTLIILGVFDGFAGILFLISVVINLIDHIKA